VIALRLSGFAPVTSKRGMNLKVARSGKDYPHQHGGILFISGRDILRKRIR